MRNFLFLLFFISISVSSADNFFEPLQYQVGEEIIKPLIAGDANFSTVKFSTESISTIISIASGANVLVQIIDALNLIIKKAVQNTPGTTEASGTTSPSTPIITGQMLSNGLLVAGIAQSGVFIQRVLNLLDYSGNALILLSSKKEGSSIFQTLFNSASFSTLTFSQLQDMSNQLRTGISVLNIIPLSQDDTERRDNQFKYYIRYGCPEEFSAGRKGYCMSDPPYFTWWVESSALGSQIPKPYTSMDELTAQSGCVLKSDCPNCLPMLMYQYSRCFVALHENPSASCPKGLSFNDSLSSVVVQTPIQVCIVDYSADDVTPFYYGFSNTAHEYPHFELDFNGLIKEHPAAFDYKRENLTGNYSLSLPIINNVSSLTYPKNLDSNVVVDISIKPLVSENAFLVSKTINGLKILRQGNVEIGLTIREITKFSNDFILVGRSYSFLTQDGFDIGVQNSFLSPQTYGIAGKTIAEQFAIKTVDTITSTGESKPVDTSAIVPCGLNKNVQVLRTRKNAEGKDENYFETQNSPACNLDWGKSRNPSKAKDLSTKEPQDFKPFHSRLSEHFKSNFFPVSDKCPAFEIDFSTMPLLKGSKFVYFRHCEYLAQNPMLETSIRLFSMVSFFLLALFKVFSA
ncbi:MAG: hypothetical protein RIT27_101 [Pseudomonadota bacterium]|jgi:hypothetical protein